MKLVEMKCKNCGSLLKVNSELKESYCQFCGTEFKIDDEVQHVQYDNMEQSGYEFEKGRIRAKQEYIDSQYNSSNTINNNVQPVKKDYKMLWIVLAWIFLLPFTATYFIAKSKKLDKTKKIVIITIMWVLFITIAVVSSSLEKEQKKNKIINCFSRETYNQLNKYIGIDNIDGNFSDSYSCDKIDLKDNNYNKIEIEMDGDKLLSIKVDKKYVYKVDNNSNKNG